MGRDAVYSEEFFHKVVGLCNEGCKVDKAFHETEVATKWKPDSFAKHQYPIANCFDPEQVACFIEHFA